MHVVYISKDEFTYPRAINLGIQHSRGNKYIVILSAHSLPVTESWSESAIIQMEKYPKAMGVYGPLLALPDATFWDRLFHRLSYLKERVIMFPTHYRIIDREGMGVLGFTNAIIRKNLWEQYSTNEEFAGGGEDGDWANHWLKEGYVAIKDLKFTVLHSHYLNMRGWLNQFKHWKSNSTP